MAKDTGKPGGKSGQSGRAPVRTRQALFRRDRRRSSDLADAFFKSPNRVWAILIWGGFILVCAVVAIWARQQPLVATGRVMNFTAHAREQFVIEDRRRTEDLRLAARQRTPRIYEPVIPVIESIEASIEHLPRRLGAVETLQQVPPEVREQFNLTQEAFEIIRGEVVDGEPSPQWRQRTERLIAGLLRRPIVDAGTYDREHAESLAGEVDLRIPGVGRVLEPRRSLLSVRDERLPEAMRNLARDANFPPPVRDAIAHALSVDLEPTFVFNEPLTTELQEQRADSVQPVTRTVPSGEPIFRRGQVLTADQLALYSTELDVFYAEAQWWRLWIRSLSIAAAVTAVGLAIAGYLTLFTQRVRRDPARAGILAVLLALGLLLACFGTVANPAILALTVVAPTVFIAVVVVIAYGQRVALAMGALHAVLVCIALDQPIGVYALILTGTSFAVLQLREIRDRQAIIRMGLYAGTALAVGAILVALIDRPLVAYVNDQQQVAPVLRQTLIDAILAGVGGLAVGVVTLAVLPAIERIFDVTTGMTLIELRDPKQPLLKQLQQRAPGTYNHSLNVASIAEAAADAIGADALLTYVGGLYHDVGKMNKPEYFVENQVGGPSKHDKLSPAMSLLVIVGHVKDGMAMAEEYGLPQQLRHFIEAHHGTTLVEFFYQRARRQAEETAAQGAEDPDVPEEIEYRYPGPRPRTKEVAILMLADAVESATRTLAEPTPARIEALVRAIANKRLMDGQFDECELTLRELQTIEESISKSVASIYHGRVVYPTAAAPAKEERRA